MTYSRLPNNLSFVVLTCMLASPTVHTIETFVVFVATYDEKNLEP